ncbi:tetratricopeptide repeat protein [Rubrobacter aplysinae]|uniref:tetratricopeptide repeat protein n=1 Tax=Rubrobacter aplysinae TaxID=909625 RepID=UPI00064B8EEB|nr:tetratricopeptide repeat protein [Rubrobacter aplysinae]
MNQAFLRLSVMFVVVVLTVISASLYLSTRYLEEQQRLAITGDTEGAMHNVEMASRLDPFSADPLQAEANMLRNEGSNREAERALQGATGREPHNHEVWQELGDLRMDYMNQPLEAAESYRRALELNPRSSDTNVELATAYLSAGKLEKAKARYEQIPSGELDVDQLYDLGRIYVRTGEPEKGVRTLQRARSRAENGLQGMAGQQRQQQLGFLTSVELAIADALVVERRYGEAYQIVANSSSEQAQTILALISSDPEGYRQTVISSDVY